MDEEKIKEMIDYINSDSSHLPYGCDYARGFKDGITRVKSILLDIINR
jgi:hypothetical protein